MCRFEGHERSGGRRTKNIPLEIRLRTGRDIVARNKDEKCETYEMEEIIGDKMESNDIIVNASGNNLVEDLCVTIGCNASSVLPRVSSVRCSR
jgi:hypothetical protein